MHFVKVPYSQNTRVNNLSKLSAEDPIEGTWTESFKEKSITKNICTLTEVED